MALQSRCKLIECSSRKKRIMDGIELLTPAQLAARLQLPVSWVYEHTQSKASNPLPVLRCGKHLRFAWNDIEHWMREQGQNKPVN